MRGKRAVLAAIAPALLSILSLLIPGIVLANTADVIAPQHPPNYTADDGWQAGTCKEEPPESEDVCSVDTPDQFFERAAAHPNWGFTQFIVAHTTAGPLETPTAELKTVRVDLPVGLSVNPGATPRCPLATFEASAASCEALGAKVGESAVTASLLGVPLPPTAPLSVVPVYNLVPAFGEPALFGLELAENEVYLKADVAWDGDYHEGFTIEVPQAADLEPLIEGLILKNRLVFDGRAGDGTFITTPSTCLGEASPGPSGSAYSTWLLAGSYAEAAEPGYDFATDAPPALESPIPPGTEPRECETIPYDPSLGVERGTAVTNSPAGAAVEIEVPHIADGDKQENSNTRTATVTLPAGMGLNPSAANGLEACTDAQFGKGSSAPVACPAASRIGSVTISSPPLPEGDLEGDVYVGAQLSRDPASGQEYRIFVAAESDRYGISVRLVGNVAADPVTGQLTTTFDENPQVPFDSFRIELDGGSGAVLSSPPTCGPHESVAAMTPWSGNAAATPTSSFDLETAPGGGPCAATGASRPHAPGFHAASAIPSAGAFSPLSIQLSRQDGEQELKGADIALAPGMTARLAGIPYCPEAALQAAAARAGGDERTAPSCPAASRVGGASVVAGTGAEPLQIGGEVFLAGPYRGAPLSLAVVTPATAGPFDLGTVVVRVALFVEPETAQVRAVSDPIPDVFGGAQLSIRQIDLAIDRDRFALNPTSCEASTIGGSVLGGGDDPADPAGFVAAPVGSPFQVTGCERLGFRPKLGVKLIGNRKRMRRAQHPRFRAVLTARRGDANLRRTVVVLPHSVILDQGHIRTICTRPRLAANNCPKRSVYGYARAWSPLLDKPLAGPVYLVPGKALPDLLVDLRGQVNIRLRGAIDSVKGERIRNIFNGIPDVPVSRFVLTMLGGKRGLLVNSRDHCAGRSSAFLNLRAQNGKRLRRKLRLQVPACGKRKQATRRHHNRQR